MDPFKSMVELSFSQSFMLREKYLSDRPENINRQDRQLNMGKGTERSKQVNVWALRKLWG